MQILTDMLYCYVASFGNIAASANAIVNLQVQNDADFEWCYTVAAANENGAAVPMSDQIILPFTIQLTDSSISRGMFSAATHLMTVAGSAKLPFVLPYKYTFKANSNVNITLTSLDGANQWNNVYIALWGKKIFLPG